MNKVRIKSEPIAERIHGARGNYETGVAILDDRLSFYALYSEVVSIEIPIDVSMDVSIAVSIDVPWLVDKMTHPPPHINSFDEQGQN